MLVIVQIDEDFVVDWFDVFNVCDECMCVIGSSRLQVFWLYVDCDWFLQLCWIDCGLFQWCVLFVVDYVYVVGIVLQCVMQYVYCWVVEEIGYEQVGWVVVQCYWCIDLLDDVVFQYYDVLVQCYCFNLVVCYVDYGGVQFVVQLCDFGMYVVVQFGVEVGQWFVEQEYCWFVYQCLVQCYVLMLVIGYCFGQFVYYFGQVQCLCCFGNVFVDGCFVMFVQFQVEGQVFGYGYVWV